MAEIGKRLPVPCGKCRVHPTDNLDVLLRHRPRSIARPGGGIGIVTGAPAITAPDSREKNSAGANLATFARKFRFAGKAAPSFKLTARYSVGAGSTRVTPGTVRGSSPVSRGDWIEPATFGPPAESLIRLKGRVQSVFRLFMLIELT
jgi:hypothetical protein